VSRRENEAMSTKLNYRIVSDFAGVKNNRSSSPFERFGDANRAAMTACAEKGRAMRVYAFSGDSLAGDLVAEYVPVNGRPQAVPIG